MSSFLLVLLELVAFALVPALGFVLVPATDFRLKAVPCTRCAPPRAQIDGPNGPDQPWDPNDEEPPPPWVANEEMLAAQRAFFDAEMMNAETGGEMGGDGLDE